MADNNTKTKSVTIPCPVCDTDVTLDLDRTRTRPVRGYGTNRQCSGCGEYIGLSIEPLDFPGSKQWENVREAREDARNR